MPITTYKKCVFCGDNTTPDHNCDQLQKVKSKGLLLIHDDLCERYPTDSIDIQLLTKMYLEGYKQCIGDKYEPRHKERNSIHP